MAAPLLSDGKYQILHATHTSQAAELLHGIALGAVCGFKENKESPRPGQFWMLRNLGGNQFVLESDAIHGIYASADAHVRGGALAGSPNPTIWTLQSAGPDQFQITTEDGRLLWVLPGSQNALTILLAYSDIRREITLWKFKRA